MVMRSNEAEVQKNPSGEVQELHRVFESTKQSYVEQCERHQKREDIFKRELNVSEEQAETNRAESSDASQVKAIIKELPDKHKAKLAAARADSDATNEKRIVATKAKCDSDLASKVKCYEERETKTKRETAEEREQPKLSRLKYKKSLKRRTKSCCQLKRKPTH